MTIAIDNTTVVTGGINGSVYFDSAILIDGNRIAAIGVEALEAIRSGNIEVMDGSDKIVMPGFANTHTHFSLTLARGVWEDMSPSNLPPFDVGMGAMPLPRLSAEENAVMCQLGALEAIRSGTTAVLEDGCGIAGYASQIVDSGLRIVLAERAWDNGHGDVGSTKPFQLDPQLADDGIERISRLHEKWNGAADGRVAVAIAAWAPDMCSPDLLRRLSDLSASLNTFCTIHLNQFWGEVEAVKRSRGKLPTEYLLENGFLNDRLVAAHCRCMIPAEEKLLGQAGVSVAFNSAIAARRGLSPDIANLEECGCNISIGTDNMSEDMVEAFQVAILMERVRRNDGCVPTPEMAFSWATENGYRALGITEAGRLLPGNKADLVVVNTRKPHMVPLLRPLSLFAHQGRSADIESVMVDGRWLMHRGVVVTMDEETIVKDANSIAQKAWKNMYIRNPSLEWPSGFRS